MATRRNHKSVYARRNEIARQQGFKSYSEKRRALTFVRGEGAGFWDDNIGVDTDNVREMDGDELAFLATYYRAFAVKGNANDYTMESPKAKFFVDVLGWVSSYNEWEERYPNGIREYAPVRAA